MNIEDLKGKVIIYNNLEGYFSIAYPIIDCGLCFDEIIERLSPLENKYTIINEKELPTDYTYFPAWLYDNVNETVSIDIEKAKEIQKDNIRMIRKKLLEEQDVIFMRAIETGDTLAQQSSAIRKQELRDLTEIVNIIDITGDSVDEISSQIESTWNEDLLGKNIFVIKRIVNDDGSVEVIKHTLDL